jgi:hypothetical protein
VIYAKIGLVLLRGQQALSDHVRNQMSAIARPGLQSHVFNVPFHRAGRNVQFQRCFFRGKPKRDQAEDLILTPSQLDLIVLVSSHVIPRFHDQLVPKMLFELAFLSAQLIVCRTG